MRESPALRRDQRFDLLGHVIEVSTKFGELVVPISGGLADARTEMAGGQAMSSGAKVQNGRRDITRQPETDETGDEEDRCSANELRLNGSAEYFSDGLDMRADHQHVMCTGRTRGPGGGEPGAVRRHEASFVGLQGGLSNRVDLRWRRLRQNLFALVVKQICLPVQGVL